MNILSVDRTRKTYHIKNSLWFIRLFLNLSHKNSNKFLIIDCRGINKRGPDKFRTKTDSPEEQWCHLNINSNSKQCNTHLSKRFLNRESETDKPLFNNRKSYWKDKEWWTFTWTKCMVQGNGSKNITQMQIVRRCSWKYVFLNVL